MGLWTQNTFFRRRVQRYSRAENLSISCRSADCTTAEIIPIQRRTIITVTSSQSTIQLDNKNLEQKHHIESRIAYISLTTDSIEFIVRVNDVTSGEWSAGQSPRLDILVSST